MADFIRTLLGYGSGAANAAEIDKTIANDEPIVNNNPAVDDGPNEGPIMEDPETSHSHSEDEPDDASVLSEPIEDILDDLRGAHSIPSTSRRGNQQSDDDVSASTASTNSTASIKSDDLLSELQLIVIKALQDFLRRPDLPVIQTLPPNLLNPHERTKLNSVARHFQNKKRARDKPDGKDGKPPEPKRNKHDSYPMKKFIEKKRLHLDQVFLDHIEANGTGGRAFLENEVTLHFHASSLTSDQMCEVFAACYHFALNLKERSCMDNVRWLFTMIMFAEMMNIVNPQDPKSSPNGDPEEDEGRIVRVRRIGHKMNERAVRFLRAAFRDDIETQNQAVRNLKDWCFLGDKLRGLCKLFGDGALFYLEKDLSVDFIKRKLHLTGDSADEGFANLKRLRLKEEAEITQMTELGRNVRRYMIAPMVERLAQGDF